MSYNYWYQLNNKTHQASKMSSIKNISLYIPHVFANYSKEDISRVFNEFIGSVKTVDLVVKRGKDGKTFNAAYGYRWRKHFGRDQLDEVIYQVTGIYNNFAPHWGMQPFAPAILP